MREDDDSARGSDATGDPADGLGGATGAGGYSSSEPFGDASFDDSYGDDSYGDDAYGDGADGGTDDGDTSTLPADDDGGYGDGEGDVVYDEDAEAGDAGGGGLDDSDLLAQQSSPLEGLGYLIDEVRDALFGDDDGDAAAVDPAGDSGEGAFDADGLHGVDPATDLDADLDDPIDDGGDHGVIDA